MMPFHSKVEAANLCPPQFLRTTRVRILSPFVSYQVKSQKQPAPGIALCLSGGGYRLKRQIYARRNFFALHNRRNVNDLPLTSANERILS
jgi:hypothetical protein